MPAHPTPPTLPRDRAEFEAHYAKDPDQWFQYLSDAYAWMKEQEPSQAAADRKLVELQVQVENLQKELQLCQTETTRAIAQVDYIEKRLDAKEKELEAVRLDLYKAQTAAFPTVASLTPTAIPDPVAKAPVAETMGTPPTPITRSTASAQLSERIPDPDKFKATRADLRRFHDAITEKLTVNRDRYPTAMSRMAYVNSRLNDEAYKLIQPYIRHGTCRLPDYEDILDILRSAYGDPNETRTARRKLDTIKQKDRDFSTFYAEFQSLSLDSGLEGDVLAPFLEKAISKELFEMLLNNPLPTTAITHWYHTSENWIFAYRSTVRGADLMPLKGRTLRPIEDQHIYDPRNTRGEPPRPERTRSPTPPAEAVAPLRTASQQETQWI
ncbi:hypothetical protein FOMA001_g6894 [Fusarium oxysporum f. sp. matthiolae]|nr:hypothetical protein FOMA001_g6894 [Fusarium oxysporum f. sp. matthiolae]